ncbi:hypothetical protein [Solidesulfovibrio magneticus]|uniref:FlxA-like protein n=1 Tax=Solidesulfovibrio magneticus (strain ATCC 700980 / DSM 13731 / RS-1) TaxID=573370 RepID=C4XTA4_SOLM1|nr:hypothetical protein [Solidesulfovibrio magneticus]BAH75901.1 hypothetical protein DMR_24100 [Solidesulfovibrio magneticus RS-1]
MDILLNGTGAMTSDSIKAYQDSRKLSQTTVSQSAVATVGQTDSETSRNTDTVEISEAARQKQQQSAETTSGSAVSSQAQGTEEETKEEETTSTREMLLKQIQKVKEQLDKANSRLAAATAKKKNSSDGEEKAVAPESEANTDERDAAQAEASEGSQDPEVKIITSEINQLTATLVTLNAQLMKEEQKGAAAGTTGSAGINEGSGLSGGLGERLPVGG